MNDAFANKTTDEIFGEMLAMYQDAEQLVHEELAVRETEALLQRVMGKA